MPTKNDTPTFNMKVVTQETGLKPDTLRAWERRYGMPIPKRTGGGHRLYSQYDIDTLKWLVARQEEGLSISNAVELWHQIEDRGEDPLLTSPITGTAQERPSEPITGERLDQLRAAWIQACLGFDEYRAQHILAEAFVIFPIESVCFELLQRGLTQIGQGWYEGSFSVQQEHFASTLALRQLDALLTATPAARGHGRLLVACPPKEQHTFSSLLLTLMFRRRNWDVVFLGADVPLERLEQAIQTINPQLVILVAQTLYTAATMLPLADRLHQAQVPLGFGGGVFTYLEDTRRRLPGYFLGTDLQSTPEIVTQLVQSPPPLPETNRASVAYQQALAHYRDSRSAIEAYVHRSANLKNLSPIELSNANEDLGNNIVAALTLGSLDLLEANIDWVQGLLINYHYRMPAEATASYVKTYYEAVKTHLAEQGQPLLDWFEKLISSPNFLKRIIKAG